VWCERTVCSLTYLRFAVVSAEHSELGLEARRRRRVSGRTEAGLHRTELPRSRLLDAHGQPLRHEIIQSRTFGLLPYLHFPSYLPVKEVMFSPCLCVSVCEQNNSKSCRWISTKFIGGVRCATGSSWLGFWPCWSGSRSRYRNFWKDFFLLLRYIRRIVRILRDQLKADTNCSFNNVYNANIFERATSLGGDAKTSASSHLRIIVKFCMAVEYRYE